MKKKLNLGALFALCTLLFAGTIPVKAQTPSVTPDVKNFDFIENPVGNPWTNEFKVNIHDFSLEADVIKLSLVPGSTGTAGFEITSNITLAAEDFIKGEDDTTFTIGIKALSTLTESEDNRFDTIIIKAGEERIGHIVLAYNVYCSGKEQVSDAFDINPGDGTKFIGEVVVFSANVPDDIELKCTEDESEPTYFEGWVIDNEWGYPLMETTILKVKAFVTDNSLCGSNTKTFVYTRVEPDPVDVPYASGHINKDSLRLEKGFVYGGAIGTYTDSVTNFQGTRLDVVGSKMNSLNMGVKMNKANDHVILHYGDAAGKVSFRVLGIGSDGGYPKTESVVGAYESEYGYEWTKVGSVKLNGSSDTINAVFDVSRNSRYVRFNVDSFKIRINASTVETDETQVSATNGSFGFGNIGLEVAKEQTAEVDVNPKGEEWLDYVEFEDSVYVKFACTTPDAEIHVFKETIDELTYEPVATKIGVYESGDSIKLTESTIIIAKAVAAGLDTSDGIRIEYVRTDVVDMPEINVQGEWPYINDLYVEFSCATEGAKIYYTLNGSDPDETSTLYNGGILKIVITEGGMSINARAFKDGDVPSDIGFWTEELYIVDPGTLPYSSGVIDYSVIMGTDAGTAGYVSSIDNEVEYAPTVGNAELAYTWNFIIFNYDSDAGKLDFQTQGSDIDTPDSAVVGVFTSVNGNTDWVQIAEFVVDGVEIDTHNTILPDTARFVKFQYMKEESGSFVVGNFNIAKKEVVGNEHFDAASASGLKVYPNPANGEFNVQVATPSVVTIFNASGAKVGSVSFDGSVVVRSLSSGLYLLRAVSADGKVSTERVVVK